MYDLDANIPAKGQTGQGFNENISLIKTSSVSFIHKSNSRKLLIGKIIDFPEKNIFWLFYWASYDWIVLEKRIREKYFLRREK